MVILEQRGPFLQQESPYTKRRDAEIDTQKGHIGRDGVMRKSRNTRDSSTSLKLGERAWPCVNLISDFLPPEI